MDRAAVEHIANLARLDVTEQELELYTKQLSQIVGYFEKLALVPTEGIEPLVTPTDIEYALRDDVVVAFRDHEGMMANAPMRSGNLYKVPTVV